MDNKENIFWPFVVEYNELSGFFEVLDSTDEVWFQAHERLHCDNEALRYSTIYKLGLDKKLGSN